MENNEFWGEEIIDEELPSLDELNILDEYPPGKEPDDDPVDDDPVEEPPVEEIPDGDPEEEVWDEEGSGVEPDEEDIGVGFEQSNSEDDYLSRIDPLFAQPEGEEVIELREANIKHFHLGGDRYQAIVYDSPVHYQEPGEEEWREIDNTVVNEDGFWMNTAGALIAKLPGTTGADEALVELSSEGNGLSWQLDGAVSAVEANVVNGDGGGAAPMNLFAVSGREEESEQEKRLNMGKSAARLEYAELMPGVTMRYELSGDCVKEDIIIANREAAENIAFRLPTGTLDYELQEDRSIAAIDRTSGEAAFYFDAPHAYDRSEAPEIWPVTVTLTPAEGYTLMTYALEDTYLNDAVYPITIDPIVRSKKSADNTKDLTLTEGLNVAQTGAGTGAKWLTVGKKGKDNAALLRFTKLPKIKSSDTITQALLIVSGKTYDSAKYMYAHEVLKPWDPKQIEWLNFSPYDPTVADQAIADYSIGASGMSFDLTNIIRKWYEGKNYGVMLTRLNDGSDNYQEIHSSESDTTGKRPMLMVNYISRGGVSGRWEYESQSAGRAGTAHVDLFNGNVVAVHTDTQMNGNLMPVSVGHTYNSCMSADADFNYRCGKGWRLSVQQTVDDAELNAKKYFVWTDGAGTDHWFENIGDNKESGDLEGLGYKLKRTGGSLPYIEIEDQAHTKMKYQRRLDGNKAGKWAKYWPVNATDSVGNTVLYEYDMSGVDQNSDTSMQAKEGMITKITDGANRATKFVYDGNKRLTEINVPGKDDGDTSRRKTAFLYDGKGRLQYIKYPDITGAADITTYSYDGNTNLLMGMQNYDGSRVNIGYESLKVYSGSEYVEGGADDQMRRVVSLEAERVVNGVTAKGAKQLITYKQSMTEVTAVDGTGEKDTAGKKLYYQFNSAGNLISVKDDLGYARFTKYDSGAENKPSEESKLRRVVINRLRVPDFGNTALWTQKDTNATNTVVIDATDDGRCMNAQSVKITKANNAVKTAYRQQVEIERGKPWTLSAYVKSDQSHLTAAYNAYLRIMPVSPVSGDASEVCSTSLTEATAAVADKVIPTDGWERLMLVYEPKGTGKMQVYVDLVNQSGTGYVNFACPQLEEGTVANSVNLVSNGDFRHTKTAGERTLPQDWTENADVAKIVANGVIEPTGGLLVPSSLSGKVLTFDSTPKRGSNNYAQILKIKGKKGDQYAAGGWAMAKSVPHANTSDRGFRIAVRFRKGTGEWTPPRNKQNQLVSCDFNFEWVGWQYASAMIAAPIDYDEVCVYAVYMKNANRAYFSNIFLHREEFGNAYEYDTDKNLVSASTRAGQKDNAKYDKYHNLEEYSQPGMPKTTKYVMKYGDSDAAKKKHRLLSSTTPMEVVSEYAYDGNGNQISAKNRGSAATPFIRNTTEYGSAKNYAKEQVDARGLSVTSDINPRTGVTNYVIDPNGTKVNYFYDASDRLETATVTADGKTYKNGYTYEQNRLKTVSHNTTSATNDVTYTFEYDGLGAQKTVKVGSQTLSTREYTTDRSHKLLDANFGNGGAVRNKYDGFDRLVAVSYDGADPNSSPRYSYAFGANGEVSRVKDHHLNRTQWTEYDQADRPIRASTREDSNGALVYRTTLSYDKYSRLNKYREETGGAAYLTQYGYDNDNRTTEVIYGKAKTENRHVGYTYDGPGRILKRAITNGSGNKIETEHTYIKGNETKHGTGATTALVGRITHKRGTPELMRLDYQYDYVGNILQEARAENGATKETTYKYDKLGQLTRVDDPHASVTWVYEYDQGGNITAKKRYAYTVADTLGTAAQTIGYGYTNASWKDQLRTYNGQTIGYDAIGNPTSYDGWAYEWQAGRQLKKMTQSADKAAYGTVSVNQSSMSALHTREGSDAEHKLTLANGALSAGSNGYKLTNGVLNADPTIQTLEYSYDSNGLRTRKKVTANGAAATTDYILHGKLLAELRKGSDKLHFFYDAQSRPAMVKYGNNYYTYLHNLQGDVLAIVDTAGNKVVEYRYDVWGKPTGTKTTASGATTKTEADKLAALNPFRYRGYVYDEETGLYYLRSRYYNPEWGRFISQDALTGEAGKLLSHNLYTYCLNNPISMVDDDGNWPSWGQVFTAVVAVAAVVVVAAVAVALAPAVICTGTVALGAMGVSATAATAIATAGTAVAGTVGTAFVADSVTAAVTGYSPVRDGILNGDQGAYETFQMLGSVATAGYLSAAAMSPGVCFVAGTPVAVEGGTKPIETVQAGDLVWSMDEHTGERALKVVKQTFVRETNELVHIYANGEEIVTTPEHPFFVKGIGWVEAKELQVGIELVRQSGERVFVGKITYEKMDRPTIVYNFEVDDFHTYFVGNSAILVHNTCSEKSHSKVAKELGYDKTNERSHGQNVYKNGQATRSLRYITPDVDSHNGGYWKAAFSVRDLANKATRSGTYNFNLTRRIGP